MNSLKLISIAIIVITSFILLLLTTNLFTRQYKSRLNSKGKVKLSFAVWYAAIFLSGANIINSSIPLIIQSIDNIIKKNSSHLYQDIMKAISLLLGTAFVWFIAWLFIAKLFTKLIFFKTNELEEMEEDHYSYFIVKAMVLIGIVFSLAPLLSEVLRPLVPSIQTTFYN